MAEKPVLFCLELSDHDGGERYYYFGQGTQFDFEKKCNELLPDAANAALAKDEKSDYHHVSWEDIIDALAHMLTLHGYQKVDLKTVCYRRGFLSPVVPGVDWNEMVKEGVVGSYELLGEYGPKITAHNLKYKDQE